MGRVRLICTRLGPGNLRLYYLSLFIAIVYCHRWGQKTHCTADTVPPDMVRDCSPHSATMDHELVRNMESITLDIHEENSPSRKSGDITN